MKVRFAPSPTGYLHIGGARTALFNWMYARAQKGTFVLRIEDTDLSRSKKEYEEEILDSMKWLGMDWDEIYYQSKRFDLYKEYAQKLLDEGKAYKDGDAVILKMPKQDIKIYDLIRGEINFDTSNFIVRHEDGSTVLQEDGSPKLKDEVLIKQDGSPAYSFCCVIDDALMEITTVIRGEDHISNTPKQIVIYEALGFKPPKFAHLPLIMGEDGGRMSKRSGAVAVTDYRKKGFLSSAIVNYLMLLGWSPGNNQEIVSMKAALKVFSIKKVNKAAAVFSMDKLRWVNNQHIKNLSNQEAVDLIKPLLEDKGYISEGFNSQLIENVVNLFKGRASTLNELLDWTAFIFVDELMIADEIRQEYLAKNLQQEFDVLEKQLSKVDDFTKPECEAAFKKGVEQIGVKSADLVHPVRVALTGQGIGPSLFDIMEILGKDKTLKRLSKAFG